MGERAEGRGKRGGAFPSPLAIDRVESGKGDHPTTKRIPAKLLPGKKKGQRFDSIGKSQAKVMPKVNIRGIGLKQIVRWGEGKMLGW